MDFESQHVDFDVSAVLFDNIGTVIDAAFYNQPLADNGKVSHSGDERTGCKEGDDELINIKLGDLRHSVFAIVILVSVLPFERKKHAPRAKVEIRQGSRVITSETIIPERNATSNIIGILFKDFETETIWKFRYLGCPAPGHHFQACMKQMKYFVDEVLDPVMIQERAIFTDKTFNMAKGQIVDLYKNTKEDTSISIKKNQYKYLNYDIPSEDITIALSWDPLLHQSSPSLGLLDHFERPIQPKGLVNTPHTIESSITLESHATSSKCTSSSSSSSSSSESTLSTTAAVVGATAFVVASSLLVAAISASAAHKSSSTDSEISNTELPTSTISPNAEIIEKESAVASITTETPILLTASNISSSSQDLTVSIPMIPPLLTTNDKAINDDIVHINLPKEFIDEFFGGPIASHHSFNNESLKKGDNIDDEGGVVPNELSLGLGWEVPVSSGKVDLDASCVLLEDKSGDGDFTVFDVINFKNLAGSGVVHNGDSLDGKGPNDDEVIDVNLAEIPPNVRQIYFVVNVFTENKDFSHVCDAFVRLFIKKKSNTSPSSSLPTVQEEREILKFHLVADDIQRLTNSFLLSKSKPNMKHTKKSSSSPPCSPNALVFCQLVRTGNNSGWSFVSICEPCIGKTVMDMTTPLWDATVWREAVQVVADEQLRVDQALARALSESFASEA